MKEGSIESILLNMKSLKKTIKKLSEESNELIHLSQNFEVFSKRPEFKELSVAELREIQKTAFDTGYEINQKAYEMLKMIDHSTSSLKYFLPYSRL